MRSRNRNRVYPVLQGAFSFNINGDHNQFPEWKLGGIGEKVSPSTLCLAQISQI